MSNDKILNMARIDAVAENEAARDKTMPGFIALWQGASRFIGISTEQSRFKVVNFSNGTNRVTRSIHETLSDAESTFVRKVKAYKNEGARVPSGR